MHDTTNTPALADIANGLGEEAACLLRAMTPSCGSAQGYTQVTPSASPSPERRREIETAISELLAKALITAGPGFGRHSHRTRLETTDAGKAVHHLLIAEARAKSARRRMLKTNMNPHERTVLNMADARDSGRLLPTDYPEPWQSDCVRGLVRKGYAIPLDENAYAITSAGRERALAEREAAVEAAKAKAREAM